MGETPPSGPTGTRNSAVGGSKVAVLSPLVFVPF